MFEGTLAINAERYIAFEFSVAALETFSSYFLTCFC